jgi:hypothetical protein
MPIAITVATNMAHFLVLSAPEMNGNAAIPMICHQHLCVVRQCEHVAEERPSPVAAPDLRSLAAVVFRNIPIRSQLATKSAEPLEGFCANWPTIRRVLLEVASSGNPVHVQSLLSPRPNRESMISTRTCEVGSNVIA